jgi:hypothetical protein
MPGPSRETTDHQGVRACRPWLHVLAFALTPDQAFGGLRGTAGSEGRRAHGDHIGPYDTDTARGRDMPG